MKILVSIFVLTLTSVVADSCNGGPQQWCKSIEKSVQCGVYHFCKRLKHFHQPKQNIDDSTPVRVELYYESQCGGCRQFILQQLAPTFKILNNTGIMDVGLYPYGNANERQSGNKWIFDCQHGEVECQVNLLETCGIHYLSEPSKIVPFIECVETTPNMQNGKECAEKAQLDWGILSECITGPLGNQLEHNIATKTASLQPRHTYVPWIVVNDQHTNDIQEDATFDLLGLVCKTYTGQKPKACNRHKENRCVKQN